MMGALARTLVMALMTRIRTHKMTLTTLAIPMSVCRCSELG